jgi:hypothetical protein
MTESLIHRAHEAESDQLSRSDEVVSTDLERELSGAEIFQKSLNDINSVEHEVVQVLGLEPGSPDAVAATDEALVYIASETIDSAAPSEEITDIVEDIAVAGALELARERRSSAQNPIVALEQAGYGDDLAKVVRGLHEARVELPDHQEVADVVAREIEKLSEHPVMSDGVHGVEYIPPSAQELKGREQAVGEGSAYDDEPAAHVVMSDEALREAGRNWQYDDNGNIHETTSGRVVHSNQAGEEVQRQGRVDDQDLAYVMAHEVDRLRDAGAMLNARDQASLEHINGLIETRGVIPQLEAARADILRTINSRTDTEQLQTHPDVIAAVHGELTSREQELLERQINERIEADKLPWTMPNSHIPQEVLDTLKIIYEGTIAQESEPLPEDVFRIPPPMKRFEDTPYAPQDEVLLATAGLAGRDGMEFTRGELQRAGVFFINRVGGGEQPIFGVPVPGLEDLPDRTFLTREEFEMVYAYQQEHGYGIGDSDPADVQTDMMVYIAMANGRGAGVRKGSGIGNAREKKYGQTRSPFVDQGYRITESIETYVHAPGKGGQRMNTMTMHLANGHPEYPGVSEMFDEDKVAHDQKYMSTGEFIHNYYQPLPTAEDVLLSMKYGLPTKRELVWVGSPS